MSSRIFRSIVAIVMSGFLMGMMFMPIDCHAQDADGTCQHLSILYQRTVISYPNVSPSTHQKVTEDIYQCMGCDKLIHVIRKETENHSYNETNTCVICGYKAY